jgi:hypothetical protein
MLRETLCVAQHTINQAQVVSAHYHSDKIASLIAEIDKHRPLGPNGKHGDLHTPTCGCEDKGPAAGTCPDCGHPNHLSECFRVEDDKECGCTRRSAKFGVKAGVTE